MDEEALKEHVRPECIGNIYENYTDDYTTEAFKALGTKSKVHR